MNNRAVIVGAGEINDYLLLPEIRETDFVIAADGGIDHLSNMGLEPDMAIGDFDSIKDKSVLQMYHHIVYPTVKDDTDMMNCIKYGLEKGYKNFLILGATGGRTAHTMANLTALCYINNHGGRAVLTDGKESFYIINEGQNILLNNKRDTTFSIFPFGCESTVVNGEGMFYRLEDIELFSYNPRGISNVIISDIAHIECQKGTALIIVE